MSGRDDDAAAQGITLTQDALTDETQTDSYGLRAERAPFLPDAQWQYALAFPDRLGYIDTTLAINGMCSFTFYHGQGLIYLDTRKNPGSFSLYINGVKADVTAVTDGGVFTVDFSDVALNGVNTLQVSGLTMSDADEEEGSLHVYIPYPTVLDGSPEEEGFSADAFRLLSDLIESDCAYGFPGAQLAVISNGRLIFESAWGKTNAYTPDGVFDADGDDATVDTLYDLASVTKLFAVNFVIQRLADDGRIHIDDPVSVYLADSYDVTIRDLLAHQGGLPANPRFFDPSYTYFSGNDASLEVRDKTLEYLKYLPYEYEPGTMTMYSDADYMLLGAVIEEVTGERLDTYLSRTVFAPLGLTHITFNPLQHGFRAQDCAATELNGNTRDGFVAFDGIRTETIRGEVHDEKAYYSMAGISGHAGLFANAHDLAILSAVMLSGGYGEVRFFSRNVIDLFTAPKSLSDANWGLGWYRQADDQRLWYFGTQSSSGTIGHQGWTGTMVMIDPDRSLIIVYLTNTVNSPVTEPAVNPNRFDGGFYTASTIGFVPQVLSVGAEGGTDTKAQLLDLLEDMTREAYLLIPEDVSVVDDTHPAVRNALAKSAVLDKWKTETGEENRE